MRIFGRIHAAERRLALGLTVALLGFIIPPAMPAGEEDESSVCAQAFDACLLEALAKSGGRLDMSLFYRLQFCAIGYSFCERFVEAFLERR